MSLENVSVDIFRKICFKLRPIDVLQLKRVCARFHILVKKHDMVTKILRMNVERIIVQKGILPPDCPVKEILNILDQGKYTWMFGSALLCALISPADGSEDFPFVPSDVDFVSTFGCSPKEYNRFFGSRSRNRRSVDSFVDFREKTKRWHREYPLDPFFEETFKSNVELEMDYLHRKDAYICEKHTWVDTHTHRNYNSDLVTVPVIVKSSYPQCIADSIHQLELVEHLCKSTALSFCRIAWDGNRRLFINAPDDVSKCTSTIQTRFVLEPHVSKYVRRPHFCLRLVE